ncbi:MAG: hypothetical protein ACI4SL_06645, partial [Candidatus Ornithospirochaeta sp.]
MNELNVKGKGSAPFDDFMLYPFFASFDDADGILSSIIGKDVRITEVNTLDMDHVVGKMAGGVEILAKNKEGSYCIVMKRIMEDYPKEIAAKIVNYLMFVISMRQDKNPDYLPILVLV